MAKNFILSENLKNDILNCIAHATHTNVNFIQVNALINAINQLSEEPVKNETGHDTQC